MELIKIREENGKQLVSGRELHEFLEVKSKYADIVIRNPLWRFIPSDRGFTYSLYYKF